MPLPEASQQLLPWWRYLLWFLIIWAITYYWIDLIEPPQQQVLAYSEFKDSIRADKIISVTLKGDQVSGRLKLVDADVGTTMPQRFVTTLPPVEDPELITLLEQHQVEIHAESEGGAWWIQLLIGILPWVLIIGLFWYASRRMQESMGGKAGPGGIFGFGKSRARRFRKGETNVTFDNVAGLENAKQDLQEITGYLRDPERYRKLGAKIPKGILLMGPPGTGKTLLAKAVAGEADVPFFSISGSEFIEMFVGVGASRVRDMFDSAKKEAPAIIFIDEID